MAIWCQKVGSRATTQQGSSAKWREMWEEFLPSRQADNEGRFVDAIYEPTLFESIGART